VSRPQVIDDEEHERVHDKVAAIDVAKDTGMVCTRTPHPSRPGARRSTIWTVPRAPRRPRPADQRRFRADRDRNHQAGQRRKSITVDHDPTYR
jgi:hypothetical protein